MEIKKEVENLRLANDINSLSLSELANKYLCNKESYDDFIKQYGELFELKTLYQLRVNRHYKKILDIISYGNRMYPSQNNEIIEKKILNIMNNNIEKYDLKTKLDDEIQAVFLFDETIGKNKSKDDRSYQEIVKGMYEAAVMYDERDNNSIDSMPEYIFYSQSFRKRDEFKRSLDTFCNKHTLTKVCNDINFLYLANYIMIKNRDNVDDLFLSDVKDVIRASIALEEVEMNEKGNFKNYKKVAKYTLKNIKKIENKREKEQEKEKRFR